MSAIFYKNLPYGIGGSGSGGGSDISITPILQEGIPLFDITIDGNTSTIYAPSGGGSSGEGSQVINRFTNLFRKDYTSFEIDVEFVSYTLISDPNA